MLSPRRARIVFACALALCLALASAAQVEQPGDYEEVRFPPEQILQEQNREIDRANFMIARDEAKPLYHHAPMDIAHHMARSSHASPFDGELYDGGQDASFAQESAAAEPTPVPVPSSVDVMPSDEMPGQYSLPMGAPQRREEMRSRVAQRAEPRVRADAGAEFRFRDRNEYQPQQEEQPQEQEQEQEQQQEEQPHQHHVLTRQAVLGHVARTFFQAALHHLNTEMIELESLAGQEVIEGHHKRSRAHRTTRLMNQQDDDEQAFLEESTTVVALDRSSVVQKKSKVIEKLHLMTLPKNMRLPTAAEKFMPAIAAPTETIELELDPVVKSTNGHRKVLTDKEDAVSDNLPAVSLPSETQDNTLRQSTRQSSSTSRSSSRSGKDQRDASSDDDGEGDDDDDDDDDDGSSAKEGGLKLLEESGTTKSLFAEKTDPAEEEAMFNSEPREADSMNGIGKVADNKQFDSFLQAQAQTRAEREAARMRMRSRRGFVKSAFNAVKGAVSKGINAVKGVLGLNKPQQQQQQQQQQGGGGKKTPQDIEDCVGCKLVWSQVEMDVGNARYIEDVQASFEHNCMDAQKSTIFYEACEDMYDDMYAMTDDYMSNKFPVAAMCARAKMCQA